MFLSAVDHTDAWIGLTGAIITAILTFVAVLVAKTRNENSTQHAASVDALNRVAEKVDGVDAKLDRHIDWHMGLLVGPQGERGPEGIEGLAGPSGLPGNSGAVGDPGQRGPRGVQGNVGDSGPRGPRGISAA